MSFKGLLASYNKDKSSPSGNPPLKKETYSPLWEKIVEYREICSSGTESDGSIIDDEMKSLGLLFIIIDEFPNELLWRIWLEGNRDNKYKIRIWFHAKNPSKVRSSWVKERLVQMFHLSPEWGSLELTKVMLAMLYEANKDEPNIQKFIFASESCIPIVPVSTSMTELYSTGPTTSWLAPTNIPNNGYAKQLQFDMIGERIPIQHVWKASQWLMISSFHAKQVIGLCSHLNRTSSNNIQHLIIANPLFSLFRDTRASDEMFFPTCLSMLGYFPILVSTTTSTIIQRHVTYSDWSAKGRSPKTFSPYQRDDILPALQQNSLFFRKIQFQMLSSSYVRVSGLSLQQVQEERIKLVELWWKSVYEHSHEENGKGNTEESSMKESLCWSECIAFIEQCFTIKSQDKEEDDYKDSVTTFTGRNQPSNGTRTQHEERYTTTPTGNSSNRGRSRSRSRDRSYKKHNHSNYDYRYDR